MLCFLSRNDMRAAAVKLRAQLGLESDVDTIFGLPVEPLYDPKTNSKFEPDWMIFEETKEETHFVVGDTKLSSKWDSDWNNGVCEDSLSNWFWPVRQVVTYGTVAGTRYCFIITPTELVAGRICKLPALSIDDDDDDAHHFQYKSIPWYNHGTDNLTVNLALWALAMMGINSGHRDIVARQDTLPLNVWWKDVSNGIEVSIFGPVVLYSRMWRQRADPTTHSFAGARSMSTISRATACLKAPCLTGLRFATVQGLMSPFQASTRPWKSLGGAPRGGRSNEKRLYAVQSFSGEWDGVAFPFSMIFFLGICLTDLAHSLFLRGCQASY